jgi:hypothetical protein
MAALVWFRDIPLCDSTRPQQKPNCTERVRGRVPWISVAASQYHHELYFALSDCLSDSHSRVFRLTLHTLALEGWRHEREKVKEFCDTTSWNRWKATHVSFLHCLHLQGRRVSHYNKQAWPWRWWRCSSWNVRWRHHTTQRYIQKGKRLHVGSIRSHQLTSSVNRKGFRSLTRLFPGLMEYTSTTVKVMSVNQTVRLGVEPHVGLMTRH